MPDPYLAIAAIANDQNMTERLNAAATQETFIGNVNQNPDPQAPLSWVSQNRYVWASSPTWGEKWQYALDSHTDDPAYEPGADIAVITDGDILATVQSLMGAPARYQADNEPPEADREDDTAASVEEENAGAGGP